MNTNKLKIQNEYKYKELCELLGDEEKARGNSRISQLKNWERYFNFHKPNPNGQKFIVTEIYDEPKEKIDGRKDGNNDKYQNFMSIVIEDYLASCNKFKIDITIGRLALYSNMVSKEYIDCKNDDEDDYFDKLKNISNRTSLDNVIFNMYHVLRDGIHGALNKLQKQGKIIYKDVLYIEIDHKISIITEEMQKEYKKLENMITNEIMCKYNKKSKSGIMNSSKIRKIYYNRITEEFIKKYNDVDKIFNGVEIIINDCNASENIIEINNKLIQIIKDNILEKNKNQVVKIKAEYEDKKNSGGFGDCKPPMANYEIDIIKNEKSYIEDTIRLAQLFCGQIKQDVNKHIENIEQAKIIELEYYKLMIDSYKNETPMAL